MILSLEDETAHACVKHVTESKRGVPRRVELAPHSDVPNVYYCVLSPCGRLLLLAVEH